MTTSTVSAILTDEGQWGVRVDIPEAVDASLPPCPGLGGWKKGPDGYHTYLKGHRAQAVADVMNYRFFREWERTPMVLRIEPSGKITGLKKP